MTFGVLFDWDGVVVDSRAQHERAWHLFAEERGLAMPERFFERSFGMRNEQLIPALTDWAAAGDTRRITELADRKEAIYRELVAGEGIAPLPGVIDLATALREAGIPRAIGSSTPRANLDAVLSTIGLAGAFDAIVAAEDVTVGKPEPEVFERCAEALDLSPRSCVVIEDAHVGIAAARAAGCKVVAVASTHPAAELEAADVVVTDLGRVDVGMLSALVAEREEGV